MKQKQLLRTLLAAVCLLVGTNAWGNETANFLSGSWTANTSTYSLPGANGVYHFTFTTTNDEEAFWHGWTLIVTNGKDTHTHGGTQYFAMRHDGYGWNATTNSNEVDYMTGSNTYDAQNPGKSSIEKAANGATVDMTITRSAGNVTVAATVTPTDGENAYEVNFSYTKGDATAESLGLYFSGEYGTVTVTNAYAVNGTVTSTQYGCNFESGETLFDQSAWITVANKTDATLNSNVVSFTGAKNTYNAADRFNFSKYNFSTLTSDANMVEVSFDCFLPSGNPQYFDGFSIGDANIRTTASDYSANGAAFNIVERRQKSVDYLYINNTSKGKETDLAETKPCLNAWVHVKIIADLGEKKMSYIVESLNGANTYFSEENISFIDSNVGAISQMDFSGRINNYGDAKIDNLVITKYVDSNKCDYTVKAFFGETELETIDHGNVDNGTEITYAINKYIIKDGALYQANTFDDNHHYVGTATISENDQIVNVTYTKPNITGTPVYFADFGDTPAASGTEYSRCSGGQTSTNNGSFTLVPASTLSDGTYKIEIGHYKNRAPLFYVGNANVGICNTFKNGATFGTTTFDNVKVVDGVAITVQPNTGASYVDNMDYVLAIKTSDDVTVSKTITSAGWATLYTPYALDFSSLSEDLTAYTASVSDGSVTLTKVQTVPANSGVVLKGKAKEYSIPVIASSKTEKGDLQGATTALAYEDFEANNSYYVLATAADNSGDVQFRKVTSGTIAEGKAYLKIANGNTGGGAKALSVMFANDPTGIATVNASEAVQPAKRIVNGKLVIEKNGKRYNAAGAEF